MTNTSSDQQKLIQAAGGLLWRRSPSGVEIAIVHRGRYDDWTLPKGKLQEGESWSEAAAREVREETGYDSIPLGFAGAISYETSKGPKLVRFWHMLAVGEPSDQIDSEVAEVAWLSLQEARTRAQYPLDRALLEVWQGPGEVAP
jgi:8-oxo-dGTP diphosphatase